MRLRRSKATVVAAAAAILALSGFGGAPANAAAGNAQDQACSTDIINAFGGAIDGRHLTFGYLLSHPSCHDALYLLVVSNTYNPRQIAVYAKRGDGTNDLIKFDQRLPFTPSGFPASLLGGAGAALCVTGITIRHARIDDIAPDAPPGQPRCLPLVPTGAGGVARAFH